MAIKLNDSLLKPGTFACDLPTHAQIQDYIASPLHIYSLLVSTKQSVFLHSQVCDEILIAQIEEHVDSPSELEWYRAQLYLSIRMCVVVSNSSITGRPPAKLASGQNPLVDSLARFLLVCLALHMTDGHSNVSENPKQNDE